MKVIFFVFVFIFGAQCLSVEDIKVQWREFQQKFRKNYETSNENKLRFEIFQKNVKEIESHNKLYAKGATSFLKGVNKFADLTRDEFLKYVNRYNFSKIERSQNLFVPNFENGAPETFDWRNNGAVTGVKDQGMCGSCWSFSATGSLEGQLKVKKGQLVSLSEQELVDCSKQNAGCEGGIMDLAFDYIKKFGIVSEEQYPYKAQDGFCNIFKIEKKITKVDSYTDIEFGDEKALENAVATIGPISVAIDASSQLQHYESGILEDTECSDDPMYLNHGVLLVGYSPEYWLVKNSWGADWGEEGYFRYPRSVKNVCGIASMASFPILA